MNTPQKHINYSLDDIARYLQGNMSPAEMHELEKAAVQDPFLADAIDGFQAAPLPLVKADLESIDARFSSGTTKVVSTAAKTMVWWKAAAAAVIVTTAGVTAWKIWEGKNAPVKSESAQTAAAVRDSVPSLTDSPATASTPALAMAPRVVPVPQQKTATVTTRASRAQQTPTEERSIVDSVAATASISAGDVAPAAPPLTTESQPQVNSLGMLMATSTTGIRAINLLTRSEKPGIVTSGVQAGRPMFKKDTVNSALLAALNRENVLTAKELRTKPVTSLVRGVDTLQFTSSTVNLVSTGNITASPRPVNYQVDTSHLMASDVFKVMNVEGFRTTDKIINPENDGLKNNSRVEASMLDAMRAKPWLNSVATFADSTKQRTPKDTTSYLLVMKENVLVPANGWEAFNKYFHDKVFEEYGEQKGNMGRIVMLMRLNRNGKVTFANVSTVKGLKSFDANIRKRTIDAFLNGPRWMIEGKFQAGNVATYVNL